MNEKYVEALEQYDMAVSYTHLDVYKRQYLSTSLEDMTRNSPVIQHIRMMPIPVQPSWITCVDYILCSHDHKDHYDKDTVIPVLKANPGARIVVPFSARPSLLEDGISEDDILACQAGKKLIAGNICIEAIPGKHNGFDYSTASGYQMCRRDRIIQYHSLSAFVYL